MSEFKRWLRAGLVLLACATAFSAVRAEFRMEREFDLAPGGRLVVDTDRGAVTVHGTSAEKVRVWITSRRDDIEEYMRFDLSKKGRTVEVSGEKIGALTKWFGWIRGTNLQLKFEIEVPRETDLMIRTAGGSVDVREIVGDVDLSTSGGGVSAIDVDGPLRARTSGGSVEIERITGETYASTSGGSIRAFELDGDLEARTSGGSVRVDRVRGDLSVRTSGGSIRISAAGGAIDAHTSGGGVVAEFLDGSRGGSISTSGGNVEVSLDPGTNLDIEASAWGGRIVCDLPITTRGEIARGSLRGTLGSGGETLRLKTSGGSVRIRER